MEAIDELSTSLPDDIDEDSSDKVTFDQVVNALSEDFQKSVMSKVESCKTPVEAISKMSIRDINELIFDDQVPYISGRHYYSIIEGFLSAPDSYKDKLQPIVEGYLSTISDLQKRVQTLLLDGKTSEEDENNKTSTASYLDTRLTAICERTKLVIYVNKVNDDVDKLHGQLTAMQTYVSDDGELNLKIKALGETLDDLNRTIYNGSTRTDGEQTKGIKSIVDDLSKKVDNIDNTSERIMPNIVTLLGVFSSIIIVILTLITTSSTWLSNANEVSVLIAFVVPSAIATLAICALTAFIRPLISSDSDTIKRQVQDNAPWWHKLYGATKQTLHKWSLWLSISVIALMVVSGTMWFCQEEADNQTHYIVKCLPMSETIDHSNNVTVQPTAETTNPEFFITQEVLLPTGEIFLEKITCAECDKHEDGFVYYCLLHQRFE